MSDIYEKLRERLDKFPQGFPQTGSGVEIDILRHLFTEEEAEIMMFIKPIPEPPSAVAERMGRDEPELGEILYSMSKKGLLLRFRASEKELYYLLAPWMIGIWEFQLNNLTPENIKLYDKFYEEGMVQSGRNRKVQGFRAIPIEKEIEDNTEVQPYEKVSEIIESNTRFAVADCICRKESRMMGEGCDKLLEACLSFGFAADYYIENEIAREISKDEAKQILKKAEEDGLVHFSTNHAGDKNFICNCCGCCCKALAYITKHNNAGFIAKSSYYASVDEDSCTACETCVDRCQTNAIQVQNELAVINREKCIGCGLCVSSCPSDSISMVHKLPDEDSRIYLNDQEFTEAAAMDTNKKFPFE